MGRRISSVASAPAAGKYDFPKHDVTRNQITRLNVYSTWLNQNLYTGPMKLKGLRDIFDLM